MSAKRAGEGAADQAVVRFAESFRALVRLERDLALAEPLSLEAHPVIEALLEGLSAAGRPDVDALAMREALTLIRLLGRRAAVLDATSAAALALGPSLVRAVGEGCRELEDELRAIALEGYVSGREERLDETAARRLADAIPVVEAAPGCVLVLPGGAQGDAQLERVLEDVGRRLLDRGARACVVHLGQAVPDSERVRRVLALNATCQMLGTLCVLTDVGEGWRDMVREAGLSLEDVRVEPDFAAGLRVALDACGLELRHRARLGEVLRRIVAPRRG